jgi:hypothetical protein
MKIARRRQRVNVNQCPIAQTMQSNEIRTAFLADGRSRRDESVHPAAARLKRKH